MTSSAPKTLSPSFYRALVGGSRDIHSLTDAAGIIQYQSPSIERILGYHPDELIGLQCFDFVHPDDVAEITSIFGEILTVPGGSARAVYRFRAKDRSWRMLEGILHNLFDDPDVGGALVISRDITDAHTARRALRDVEQRLQTVVDHAPVVLWSIDAEGRFTLSEGRGLESLGLSPGEVVGQSLFELYADNTDIIAGARKALQGQSNRYSTRVGDVTHETIARPHLDTHGRVIGVIGLSVDVTERDQLAEELRRAQRLEAVGLFAGGLAHDFNNLLTAIMGCSSMLSHGMAPGDPLIVNARQITAAARRGADLTRQLLAFARKDASQAETVALPEILAAVQPLMASILGERISLSTDIAEDVWPVHIDRGQLEQVMLNLASNARDAMADGGALRICVYTSNVGQGASGVAEPRRYSVIEFRDTGCGMSAEVMERIFDPFFSSKPEFQGTGLGLSSSYGTITRHGGTIRVDSSLGQGSSFAIMLPSCVDPQPSSAGDLDDASPARAVAARLVLLVDDQKEVLSATASALEYFGHRVVTACNGREALARLESDPEIDVLITDMVMPGMMGAELVRRARELRPTLPILTVSGYHEQGDELIDLDQRGLVFIKKPYLPEDLAAAVDKLHGKEPD